MAINRDDFIEQYLDEVADNLTAVDRAILTLKKDPANEDAVGRLLRALHTVKGSSRMLRFSRMESLAHGMETVFKGVRDGRYGIDRRLVSLILATTRHLRRGADRIRETRADEIPTDKLLEVFEKVYANEPYTLPPLEVESGKLEVGSGKWEVGSVKSEVGSGKSEVGSGAPNHASNFKLQTSSVPPGPPLPPKPRRRLELNTVRIKLSRMDQIIGSFNNLIIRQLELKTEKENLAALEADLRAIFEPSAEEASRPGTARRQRRTTTPAERACLKQLGLIRKSLAARIELLEHSAFEVQDEIFSIRMLPLSLVLDPLQQMTEEMAVALNKEIDLTLIGTDITVDKLILERLHDPVIHILRNAIDHGLESPEVRAARGKPRTGRITIECELTGGHLIIRISDDGRGIDYDRVRREAIVRNPDREEEIRAMDDAALNGFIFASGFSTSEEIRVFSGRGVGLDIVRHNIDRMEGKITLTSEPGRSTTFLLTLPLSLATVEGFFVEAGGARFMVPSSFVREVALIGPEQRMDLLHREAAKLNDRIMPLYRLSAILDPAFRENTPPAGAAPETWFVVVVEAFGERIGVVVDAVAQYASLIYKPMPRSLSALKLLQGIVFDEHYDMITILYIPEVVKRFKRIRDIDSRKRFSTQSREYKKILVVDDSFSAREIEKSILEMDGYNVITAGDGIEGLEQLRRHHCHLIITDIKMPRMDGLTYVENIRRDSRYAEIPVIVISSVDDEATRRTFSKQGANAFIVKSAFDRGDLLGAVRELIG